MDSETYDVLDTRRNNQPVQKNDCVVDAGYSMLNRRYMDSPSGFHTDSNISDGKKEVKNIAKKVVKHEGAKFGCILAIIAAIAAITLVIVVILFVEIGKLKSQNDSLRQQLISSSALQSQQLSNNSQVQWAAIYHLSNETELLKDTTLIGRLSTFSVPSCADLPPSSPSGYYWVMTSYGFAVRVYCDMIRSCGNITGGWMRVAELDMTMSGQECPMGLERINALYCRRRATNSGCSSVHFPSYRQSYTHICGRIIGRQIDTPDAFESLDINETYIDGVGLTYGSSRQHIWSFAGGQDDNCNNVNSRRPHEVGDNYFCDSGILWNGDCQTSDIFCSFNNPPWFYRQLSKPTTDDIEMRLCRDRDRNDEDIHIQITEIYIQ